MRIHIHVDCGRFQGCKLSCDRAAWTLEVNVVSHMGRPRRFTDCPVVLHEAFYGVDPGDLRQIVKNPIIPNLAFYCTIESPWSTV